MTDSASKLIAIGATNVSLVGAYLHWQGAGFLLTLAAVAAVLTGTVAGVRAAREFERRGWTTEQLLRD